MLKMPQRHTRDERANAIIAQYLNGNILELVRDQILEYEALWKREAAEDDTEFQDAVSIYFPENYPQERMGKMFLGLRALLESEYEFVPELAMEYVMYRLIEERVQISDDIGSDTQEPITSGREYVIQILKEEYPDKGSIDSEDEDSNISWKEKLERLEDLHYYEDIYFWDIDYLQLDYYTESELKESPVSKYLGIGNITDENRKFVLPPEWLK